MFTTWINFLHFSWILVHFQNLLFYKIDWIFWIKDFKKECKRDREKKKLKFYFGICLENYTSFWIEAFKELIVSHHILLSIFSVKKVEVCNIFSFFKKILLFGLFVWVWFLSILQWIKKQLSKYCLVLNHSELINYFLLIWKNSFLNNQMSIFYFFVSKTSINLYYVSFLVNKKIFWYIIFKH